MSLTGRSPLMLGELGAGLALAGRPDEALAIPDELRHQAGQSHIPPMTVARLYMYLGQMEELFTWLDRAFEQHDAQAVWPAIWPGPDHVRADPRYPALLRRHGLEVLLGPREQRPLKTGATV